MADKQQNILVNFKYNTAELERAQGIVNRANEANNRLQQSAQKAGDGSSQAYRGATQSIVAMQNQLTRLKSIIEVTTDPKRIAQLSAQYKQLKAQLDATNKAYFEQAKAIKSVQGDTKNLTQNFGELYSAIRLVIAGGIVKELVSFSLNMSTLAGNVEGVERAFNRAFPNAQTLLSDLQRATHGAVSEFELMQRTLQATNLGVAVEQLPILFEFAATRAQQTGESVDYLVDSIVRGIGRKSLLILDNLGLSATRLKEQFNGASLASQSVADVTKGVAEIARVELEKMGGFAETSATKVDQLKVSWQQLRVEVSKRFAEGGLADQLKELIDSYQAWLEARRRGISIEELFQERQRQEIAQISVRVFTQRNLTGTQEEQIKVIEAEIEALTKDIGAWTKFRDTQNELIKTQREEREALVLGTNGLVMTGKERQNQIKILEEQIELNKKLRDANKEDALIDQEALRLLQARLETLRKSITQGTKPQIETLETLRDRLKELKEQIEDTPTSELGVMKSLEKEADKVQKKIDKILADLYFLGKQEPKVTITVTTKPESDLTEGIPLADRGLTPEEMTDLINSDRTDLSGTFERSKQKAEEFRKELERLIKTIPDLVPPTKYTQEQLEQMVDSTELFNARLRDAFKEAKTDFEVTGIDIFTDQLKSFEDAEVQSLQNRLNTLRNFYDEQTLLAGDNERAKKELRLREERETAALQKKIAQREKEARRFSVIIDTAAGIARAFATAPNIAVAIVQAALVAAQGASQLAIINRTVPRFAKGVIDLKGPGTGTSDSIDAKLSRGESVMTAKETHTSRGILKDIRAKKLDDKVLQNLKLTADGVKYVGMDDSRIVKEIRELKDSQPNLVEQSGMLYRQFNKGKDYRRKVRLKNMGY